MFPLLWICIQVFCISLEALPFRVSNGYFGAWKVLHTGMCSTPQPLHVEERLSLPCCPSNPVLSPIFYFLLALLQISTKNLEHFHRHLRFLVYYLLASLPISCRRLVNPCLKKHWWSHLEAELWNPQRWPRRWWARLPSDSATDLLSDCERVTYRLWAQVLTNLEHH